MTVAGAQFYQDEGFFPSHRALADEAALTAHMATREALLCEHLKLPLGFFEGARVGEFGADTGENALVFARWGARVTAVEPNARTHPLIEDYRERFDHDAGLEQISGAAFETFEDRAFDLVNAEGFIATIVPERAWVEAARRLTRPGGYLHISFFETRGAFLEAATAAIVRLTAEAMGGARDRAARTVVHAKWARLASTRPFDAWWRDHCENPAARLDQRLDAGRVVTALAEAGFTLHAASPSLDEPASVAWPKRAVSPEARAAHAVETRTRAALGHAIGAPALWIGGASGATALGGAIDDALVQIDATIETPSPANARRLSALCAALAERTARDETQFYAPGGLDQHIAALAALARVSSALADGALSPAAGAFSAEPLVSVWGAPVHHIVCRRAEP